MKRTLSRALLAAGLAVAWALSPQTHDASELLPVQVLCIRAEEGKVTVSCDNGAAGRGETLEAALSDMERTAKGVLFLDTAEHILIYEGARELAGQTARCTRLRPAAKLYFADSEALMCADAAAFLRAHSGRVTLSEVRAGLLGAEKPTVPRLVMTEGRLRLIEG